MIGSARLHTCTPPCSAFPSQRLANLTYDVALQGRGGANPFGYMVIVAAAVVVAAARVVALL
eukprot:1745035-Alexandrium_andersonii.AAC.1